MGKLIVIDGLDGSGKETQTRRLAGALQGEGIPVRTVHFPDYQNPSSALVRQYLQGLFGAVGDVSPYAASSFYAVDRYASFRTSWHKDYEAGTLILSDRYVTSNLIHQMVKLPRRDWDDFGDWLEEYEYKLLGLPRPAAVLYLDVAPEVSAELLRRRGQTPDIHESNLAYLRECRACANHAARQRDWDWIDCTPKGTILPIESIAEIVYTKVKRILREIE